MSQTKLALFEGKEIRKIWNSEIGDWYFSVVDVIEVLTDSINPTDYFKKLRKRDIELGTYIGTNCPQVEMKTNTGKNRKTLSGNTENILRIIQSIPSKKAESFKRWLAQVGAERINEIHDPELAIERAISNYRKKGYDEAWITQRLKSIEIRKELTGEWNNRGIKEGIEYAILTNEILREWSGMTTSEYKDFKGLKKESLKDNMTNLELVLGMLAEASATEIIKAEDSKGFEEVKKASKKGGKISGNTRKEIELQTGKKIISSQSEKQIKKLK